MKYIVYKTTNLINNKIYIGVHQTVDPDVFDGYLGCDVWCSRPSSYKIPKTAFLQTVKKYGPGNFKRDVLFIYDNNEDAYLKEQELVTFEFINRSDTYNMVIGGKGGVGMDLPIYLFTLDGMFVKLWESTYDVSEYFNTLPHSFYNCILFKESLFGYFWSRESIINVKEYAKRSEKQTVYKYDKITKRCVLIYPSIYEAAKLDNINRSSLTTSIKLESLVNNKFYYSHTFYKDFKESSKQSLKNKIYYLYNLEGYFIGEFTSKNLMLYLNTKHWNTIYRAIHALKGVYRNYLIKLSYEGCKIDEIKPRFTSKCVNVFTKDGQFIKMCTSIQQASKEFNTRLSSINRVLRGLMHSSNNYIFKLVNL